MPIFSSKSQKGFYDSSIHAELPEDAFELPEGLHMDLINGQSNGKVIDFSVEPPALIDPPVIFRSEGELTEAINVKVESIYNKWMRFEAEYVAREAAAQAYKDAGYTGTPGVWITSFAVPAGVSNKDAADLILAQAAQLRGALEALGGLRMRKYELVGLEGQALEDKHAEICAAIDAVVASLPA